MFFAKKTEEVVLGVEINKIKSLTAIKEIISCMKVNQSIEKTFSRLILVPFKGLTWSYDIYTFHLTSCRHYYSNNLCCLAVERQKKKHWNAASNKIKLQRNGF